MCFKEMVWLNFSLCTKEKDKILNIYTNAYKYSLLRRCNKDIPTVSDINNSCPIGMVNLLVVGSRVANN